MTSRFASHEAAWHDCTKCPLHSTRNRVVLCRGQLPCDLLFVGESPSESENVIGAPFVGPAGKLLDSIIAAALEAAGGMPCRVALTNLIACIPLQGGEKRDPTKQEIMACQPRLLDLMSFARPGKIVFVGALAGKYAPYLSSQILLPGKSWVSIIHPAHILRQEQSVGGFQYQQCVARIASLLVSE